MGRLEDNGKTKFIVVCIDHYTKWIETKVIDKKTAQAVCQAIDELIISKYGRPKRILSDCGLEFNNKIIEVFARQRGIKSEFASPFHHQTTGAVERVIQTLMNKIKKLTEFGKKRWTKLVEAETLAVNLSYNRAIGMSPFIGLKLRLPELEIDKEMNKPRIRVSKRYIESRRDKVSLNYKKEIVKGKVDITRKYKVGDKVLVFRPTQNKLDANWHEGYRISKILSEDAYMVKRNRQEIRVNKRHIRIE